MNRKYYSNDHYLSTIALPIFALIILFGCVQENNSTSSKLDYLRNFGPQSNAAGPFIFDENVSHETTGLFLLITELEEFPCKNWYEGYLSENSGTDHIQIVLNKSESGTYRIVPPNYGNEWKASLFAIEEKLARMYWVSGSKKIIPTSIDQPVEGEGMNDYHQAYSGEIVVSGTIPSNIEQWQQGIFDGNVSINANFPMDEVRTESCTDIIDENNVIVENTCNCVDAKNDFYTCVNEPLNTQITCCVEENPLFEEVGYSYSTDLNYCPKICLQTGEFIEQNLCAQIIDNYIGTEDTKCSGCESMDATGIVIYAVYDDSTQLEDESIDNIEITYQFPDNTEVHETTIPSLIPQKYARPQWGIDIDRNVPNSYVTVSFKMNQELQKSFDIPYSYTGCTNRNVSYQNVIIPKTGEGEIIVEDVQYINPCDDL